MNEAAAREVTLLEAFETAQPHSPHWIDDDRAWADRVAREAAGAPVAADAFVAQRARHAMQRLGEREPVARRVALRVVGTWRGAGALAVIAFLAGLFADSIGPGQRINLLAPPLWGVLLWNLLVYAGLVAGLLAGVLRRQPPTPGPLVRGLRALLQPVRRLPAAGGSAAAWRRFAALWSARCAGLWALRAQAALHVASAALGLGLIAGLYARGLVLDERAAWESTFLSPAVAHEIVMQVLAPAARLSAITLPDAAGFAAMQAVHGDARAGAPAAVWIHLIALTLMLFVVLPRALLALACTGRARWRAARFAMPLAEPYYQRLLRWQRGAQARVQAWPYAATPSPQAALGLRTLLAEAFGPRVALQIEPTVAFGAEDDVRPASPADTSHLIAWFDLGATPEAEHHGRFVRLLAQHAPAGASVVVLVDEAAFLRRFAAAPERVPQRRAAWQAFGASHSLVLLCVDLDAPDTARFEGSLNAALAAGALPMNDAPRAPPVRAGSPAAQ